MIGDFYVIFNVIFGDFLVSHILPVFLADVPYLGRPFAGEILRPSSGADPEGSLPLSLVGGRHTIIATMQITEGELFWK